MAFDRASIRPILTVAGVGTLLAFGGMAFHRWWTRPGPGRMLDEARLSGRVTFAAPDEDYFHDADGGLDLTLDEIQGRNTWMVWSAGNDRLWDWLGRETAGGVAPLKIGGFFDPQKDTRAPPGPAEKLKQIYGFRRENRMARLGLINEPCFEQAKDGDARRYGLWLHQRQMACMPDPFENGEKYRS